MSPQVARRAQQAYQLSLKGLTYVRIGHELQCSSSRARELVKTYEHAYATAYHLTWRVDGRHCEVVGRARDAAHALRDHGPMPWRVTHLEVSMVTEADYPALVTHVRHLWEDERVVSEMEEPRRLAYQAMEDLWI
jgi:hypothetical protein